MLEAARAWPGGVAVAGGGAEAGAARVAGVAGSRALLRVLSLAVDRLRASGAAAAAGNDGHDDELKREEVVCIERTRLEAAMELAPSSRRPRTRRTRRAVAAEESTRAHDVVVTPARAHLAAAVVREAGVGAGAGLGEVLAVEVDARADDFIWRFREQLRLQRLDSILRYRDTLTYRG
ncbi:hypothetical protein SETIT_9G395200v2 [Setaria italica]|uniref:Uncharacterized protein n=1 Tax=Setaria italica TaxID=4555 RepID=A0A368SQQ3_SETIT|nr:hypothetical protein SETIT_9G395200v2 [Setaria italica]